MWHTAQTVRQDPITDPKPQDNSNNNNNKKIMQTIQSVMIQYFLPGQ